MNYITLGERKNPAILFLHGWGGSVNSFLGAARVLSGFGFYVILVDFMGFGESPEPKEAKTIYSYAQDVESLLKKLNLKKLTIVGHSFGGRVAIILAAKNLCKKLVLVDSAGVKPRHGLIYKIKVCKYKRLKEKIRKGKADASLLGLYGSSDYKALSPVMKETFVKVVNEDLTPLLSSIKCETLIVWGKNDKDTPMYMAKIINRGIENSRLLIYNAGHYSYLERSENFILDLYDFLLY